MEDLTDDQSPGDQLGATQDPQTGDWVAKPTSYADLARQFDAVHSDTRGGTTFDYFTGEQCLTRLNEQGPGFFDFEITEHGISAEADEVWVLGKLTCRVIEPDPLCQGELRVQHVVKMQFGSQKLKRSRSSGQVLDLGFDLKGAATDALKKCASQIGVGLYLWKKRGGRLAIPDDGVPVAQADAGGTRPQAGQSRQNGQAQGQAQAARQPTQPRQLAQPAAQDWIDHYEMIRAEAVTQGFRTNWIEQDSSQWSQPQIEGYCKLVQAFLDKRATLAS